jgi:hypothetical protein
LKLRDRDEKATVALADFNGEPCHDFIRDNQQGFETLLWCSLNPLVAQLDEAFGAYDSEEGWITVAAVLRRKPHLSAKLLLSPSDVRRAMASHVRGFPI